MQRVSGAWLIMFHEPEASKGHVVHGKDTLGMEINTRCMEMDTRCMEMDTRRIQFSLYSGKKPTNFGSQQTVCELFADGAAQVRSPIHTYAHLVCEPFDTLVYMRL